MDAPEYTPVFPSADLAPEHVQALVEAYRGMSDAERWVVAIEGSERAARAGTETTKAIDALQDARTTANVFLVVACVFAFALGWIGAGQRKRRPRSDPQPTTT